jgi:hypothetical protein
MLPRKPFKHTFVNRLYPIFNEIFLSHAIGFPSQGPTL